MKNFLENNVLTPLHIFALFLKCRIATKLLIDYFYVKIFIKSGEFIYTFSDFQYCYKNDFSIYFIFSSNSIRAIAE